MNKTLTKQTLELRDYLDKLNRSQAIQASTSYESSLEMYSLSLFNPIVIALLFVLLFDNFASSISFNAGNCTWQPHTNAPEAYYANMKQSVKGNKSISHLLNQMHLSVNRIEGVSSNQVYIPKDILNTFQSKQKCKLATSEKMN